jgi:hypothetical protein
VLPSHSTQTHPTIDGKETNDYEIGWGTSFHFAPMFKDSSFMQCMSRHEDFLALKLGLEEKQVCLDVRSITPKRMRFF